jgi:hypothetical protein
MAHLLRSVVGRAGNKIFESIRHQFLFLALPDSSYLYHGQYHWRSREDSSRKDLGYLGKTSRHVAHVIRVGDGIYHDGNLQERADVCCGSSVLLDRVSLPQCYLALVY